MSELDDLLDPGVKDTTNSSQNVVGSALPNATATLALGIISIVGCFLYAIPGLICGIIAVAIHSKDKKLYQSDPASFEVSYKNAKAGFICAIIGLSLSALYLILLIFVFGVFFTAVSRF